MSEPIKHLRSFTYEGGLAKRLVDVRVPPNLEVVGIDIEEQNYEGTVSLQKIAFIMYPDEAHELGHALIHMATMASHDALVRRMQKDGTYPHSQERDHA